MAFATALFAALCAHAQLVSPNLERGFDPQKAYALEEIGVVNVFNGNLNVTLPIGPEYPVSSTLSYGIALQYGGNNWEYDTVEEPQLGPDGEPLCDRNEPARCKWIYETHGYAYPTRYDNAGFGWRLHFGRLIREGTTGIAAYESPDGAVHSFYPTLHDTDTGDPADTLYTRDGSYLRMKVTGTEVTVESPDGTVREFDTTAGHPSNGGVVAIRDQFGNSVTIDYAYAGALPSPRLGDDYPVWHLHDSVGRNHYVYWKPTAAYHEGEPLAPPVEHWSVGEVRVQMPGTHALWKFHYVGEDGASPPWATLARPCMDVAPARVVGDYVQAALLEKIVPPAGGVYTFTYDMTGADTPACHESLGALKSVILPTLGKVEWQYTLNIYPPNPTAVTNHKNPPSLYKSLAVAHRKVRNAANAVTGYREYVALSDRSLPGAPALEHKVTVSDYTDDSKSAILGKSESFFTLCNDDACVSRGEYALPFTRKDVAGRAETDEAGRHLSTITYGLNGDWTAPLQRTYVKYEADIALNTAARGIVDYNRRLQSQRTVHYTASSSEWIDNISSEFDGLGHYRVNEVKASFGGTSRITKQNFNPAAGVFTIGGGTFVLPSSWVLNRFEYVEVTQTGSDGTSKLRTDYCFAETGFLERKRTRRLAATASVNDLLAVYSGDGGNVKREAYYGGDEVPLPGAVTCTSTIDQPFTYAVDHSYSHGVRNRSQYFGAGFPSLDLVVDPSGLVVTSKNPAGKPTTFKYDALGRLEEMRPDGIAWAQYEYSPAGDSTPAKVIARQWPYGTLPGITPLTETRYYYDHLGRLIQQRNWMAGVADHQWSAVKTSYDALGRVAATSVAVGTNSGDYVDFTASETAVTYDALGRVVKTRQPDGKSASVVYTDVSTVKRTVAIATSSAQENPVSTRETMDGLGRLVSIIENEHVENGLQKGIETIYRYDAGDRLTTVVAGIQTRTFQYDGAGLLTSESHPEIEGEITYERYDSAGHVMRKKTPIGTLLMTYDPAERLKSVSVKDGPALQEFTYDTTSRGKPATAARHNHHAELGDIIVTETLRYDGPGGRLSSKETAIRTATANGWPTGQTFSESYTYDAMGEVSTVTYPTCSGCGSLVPPRRTAGNQFERGYLKSVMGYTKDMKYHPNGLLSTLQRRNAGGGDGPLYQQQPDLHGMNRPGGITLTGDCTDLSISKHPEAKEVAPGQPVNLSVQAAGATKYEWFVAGSTTPIGGQHQATLSASVTEPTVFFARVSNATCSVDSAPAQVSLCTPPSSNITTFATINPNGLGTASVAAAGSATYAWSVENGTLESGQGTREITFSANCTGPVTLRVTVTAAGCPGTSSRTVTVVTPSVTVTVAPNPVVAGASTSLTATLSATGPWSLTWQDDPNSTTTTRPVTPRRTTTYTVTHVNGCAGSWASVKVDVTPPPVPAALQAIRTAAGMQLTWSVPAGADVDAYTIYRCEMSCVGGTGSPLPQEATTPQYLDQLVVPERAYVYQVSARKLDTSSALSAIDFASGVHFSHYPIVAGITPAKFVQLTQMRMAVDGVRLAAGLPPGIFTDTPQSGLPIRARHVLELRDALNEALRRLGYPDVVFAEPTLTPGSSRIRASYFNQIMGGVQ